MIHMNWGGFVGAVEAAFRKHSPSILTGLGIAGMLGTTVLAVRATPEALRRIEEEKEERGLVKLGVVDTVKIAGPCYISPVITGAVSVACLIGANNVSNRRNAALSAAYSFSESALRTYREQVVETVGERKERDIHDKAQQANLDRATIVPSTVILSTPGKVLCFDPLTNQAFYSSVDAVQKAENTFNFRLRDEMYLSLNEFYDLLEVPHSMLGGDLGWSVNRAEMNIRFSSLLKDDIPCLVLDYSLSPPVFDYRVA